MASPSSLIRTLAALRGSFSITAQRQQRDALKQVALAALSTSQQIIDLHRELLFLSAFPRSSAQWQTTQRLLDHFHGRLRQLPAAVVRRLTDSGIAGTTSLHTFMFGTVQWLAAAGERLEPHWANVENESALDVLIRSTLLPAEWDAYDGSDLDTLEWLSLAAGVQHNQLPWLVRRSTVPAMRSLYDAAELPVGWHIHKSPRSVTHNRVAASRTPPTPRKSFRRLPDDPLAWIRTPLRGVQRVSPSIAKQWLDGCRAALVARCREVAPTIYANNTEVYVADLGEGCDLCVIGAHPSDRLALEANYGYVLFSNGIPIGYGGVTPLGDQANTGANIFEEFRGSEAAFLFAQALRAFRTLFGISRFVVNPYQFGAENDEALLSGAFWFYDRLGFRSAAAATRQDVDRERKRLHGRVGARTPLRTLKRFAAADLILQIDARGTVPLFNEQHLIETGLDVATSFSGVDAGWRQDHALSLAQEHKRQLTGSVRPLTPQEKRGALLLAPIIHLIRGSFNRWTPAERKTLWAMVRAKGLSTERRFVQLSRRHRAFWKALNARCARSGTNDTFMACD